MFGHHSHNYILTLRTEDRWDLLLNWADQIEFHMNAVEKNLSIRNVTDHLRLWLVPNTKKNDIFKLQKMQINQTKNRADFKSPYA